MKGPPGLPKVAVQPRRLGGDGVGVGALHAVKEGYKGFFDQIFHSFLKNPA